LMAAGVGDASAKREWQEVADSGCRPARGL